jgi:hypothetical protein
LTAATNIDPQYQGYLVTSRMEPASAAEVGSMLRVDGRKALAALTVLTRAGFLEQVPWPYADSDGPIVDSQSLRLLQNVAEASRKPARNRGGKGRKQPKNEDEPLIRGSRNGENGETAAQNLSEGGEPPKDQTPPCDGGNGAALRATAKAPTAAPSTSSANLDAGAGPSADGRDACPSSLPMLGQVVRLTRYRYSLSAWAFADAVLLASGYREPDAAAKECEKAHWAKAWDTAVAAFGPELAEQLKSKILGEAATLRRSGRPKDNCEAFLMAAWNNDVRDLRRRRKSGTA